MSLCCIALVVGLALGGQFPMKFPVVNINLDLPPEQRWTEVVTNIVKEHGFEYSYQNVVNYWNHNVPKEFRGIVDNIAATCDKFFPAEYTAEIRGVANAAAQLGFGNLLGFKEIVALNLVYELTTACTSIVSQDLQGRMWHSRNLDWSFGNSSVANITVYANFQSGGKTIYTGVTWAGYVGILTGIRVGAFSISLDERWSGKNIDIAGNLAHLAIGASTVAFLARDALAQTTTYDGALSLLANHLLTTPVYYIIAGVQPGQGAVVSRSWDLAEHGVWQIPYGQAPWFIVETNYDNWMPPPRHDDRQDLAIAAMKKMGQANVSPPNLWNVMMTPSNGTQPGVKNPTTQYTVVMNAELNYFEGLMWQ